MKKQFLFFAIAACLLLFANNSALMAQSGDDPYVLISEYTFHEAKVDDAIDLLSDLQLKTLEGETGCMVFDVLAGEEDPDTIFIYESYENENAYKIHVKKNYYVDIVTKKLKPLTKQLKTTKVFPLNFEGGMSDAEF